MEKPVKLLIFFEDQNHYHCTEPEDCGNDSRYCEYLYDYKNRNCSKRKINKICPTDCDFRQNNYIGEVCDFADDEECYLKIEAPLLKEILGDISRCFKKEKLAVEIATTNNLQIAEYLAKHYPYLILVEGVDALGYSLFNNLLCLANVSGNRLIILSNEAMAGHDGYATCLMLNPADDQFGERLVRVYRKFSERVKLEKMLNI